MASSRTRAGESDRFALCTHERFLTPGPVDRSVSEEESPFTVPEYVSGTSGSRRCITVDVSADTGVFDTNGDPVDFDRMPSEVTVVGHFELSEEALPASYVSEPSGLVLNAAVIEEGPLGAFLQLSGLLEDEAGAPEDVLRFLLRPDQGFGASTSLPALLQDGTRIFDRTGEEFFAGELDDIVSADVDGVFGAFEDSGKLFYKAAFVMLADEDGGPSGRAELEGVVRSVDLGARSLEVQSSDGPERSAFVVPFGLGVHFVYEDDDDSVNEVGTLDELAPGTEVEVTYATWAASSMMAPATSIVAFGPPSTSLP